MSDDKGQRMFSIEIAFATQAVSMGITMIVLGGAIATLGSAPQLLCLRALISVALALAGLGIALCGWLKLSKLKKEAKSNP